MLIQPKPIGGATGATAFTGLTDTPSSYTGQSLRRPRVNDGATALEFDYDGVDIINVEEARSDIRSTTRAGYSTFDSQPGIQALLDILPANKGVYFPSGGSFNLNGKMITTTQIGQSLTSSGMGAELTDGGINIREHRNRVDTLRLTGVSAMGISIDVPHVAGWHDASYIDIHKVFVQDKVLAAEVIDRTTYVRFTLSTFHENTTGVILNNNGTTGDYGDIFFSQCIWMGNGLGMHWKKIGGVNMIGSKIMHCSVGGLLIESQDNTATNSPIWGNYIANCTFENSTNYDLKVTAAAGVNAAHYPWRLQIVGGEVHRLNLEKCNQVSMEGVLLPISVTWGAGATNIMATNCSELRGLLTGACTSYIITGHDSTKGAFIKVPNRLLLIDSLGENYL